MFDIAVFGSLFLTLFVIMDPPGITPIFLALTSGRPAKVQRDEQQEQTTGDHQRGRGDVQIVQDLLTADAEDSDHTERDRRSLPGHLPLDLGGTAGGEGEEDRRDAGRVHDHEKREEEGSEDSDVEHSEGLAGVVRAGRWGARRSAGADGVGVGTGVRTRSGPYGNPEGGRG